MRDNKEINSSELKNSNCSKIISAANIAFQQIGSSTMQNMTIDKLHLKSGSHLNNCKLKIDLSENRITLTSSGQTVSSFSYDRTCDENSKTLLIYIKVNLDFKPNPYEGNGFGKAMVGVGDLAIKHIAKKDIAKNVFGLSHNASYLANKQLVSSRKGWSETITKQFGYKEDTTEITRVTGSEFPEFLVKKYK